MKLKYLLIIIPIFVCNFLSAQIPSWQWAIADGCGGYIEATGSAVDKNGNTYITGYFMITSIFDTTVLYTPFDSDIFIAKYDSIGQLLWIKTAGGVDDDYGEKIAVDNQGNCYIVGEISHDAYFDNIHCFNQGYTQVFIAKYSPDGHVQWIKFSSGQDFCYASNIFTDSIGNSYLIGNFRDQFDLGNLTSTGLTDAFIIKFDSSGHRNWIKQITGISNQVIQGIQVDGSGNCYVMVISMVQQLLVQLQ
jgi:hypothetical protein